MAHITDFRVDIIEIDEAKFYRLSERVQNLCRTYWHPLKPTRDGYIRFSMPIYRWQEIEAAMGDGCEGRPNFIE